MVVIARRVLMAVAKGEPVPWEDVDELVGTVLQGELVALALAVRDGGAHAVTGAVRLAAAVAATAAVDDDHSLLSR
ncbi:MAG: hypothetical protein IT348_04375 [Candidatus Eisenbacteria bacterium]|nr:hypothetical protein [Candidatus Eisenbacteria bacterium]